MINGTSDGELTKLWHDYFATKPKINGATLSEAHGLALQALVAQFVYICESEADKVLKGWKRLADSPGLRERMLEAGKSILVLIIKDTRRDTRPAFTSRARTEIREHLEHWMTREGRRLDELTDNPVATLLSPEKASVADQATPTHPPPAVAKSVSKWQFAFATIVYYGAHMGHPSVGLHTNALLKMVIPDRGERDQIALDLEQCGIISLDKGDQCSVGNEHTVVVTPEIGEGEQRAYIMPTVFPELWIIPGQAIALWELVEHLNKKDMLRLSITPITTPTEPLSSSEAVRLPISPPAYTGKRKEDQLSTSLRVPPARLRAVLALWWALPSDKSKLKLNLAMVAEQLGLGKDSGLIAPHVRDAQRDGLIIYTEEGGVQYARGNDAFKASDGKQRGDYTITFKDVNIPIVIGEVYSLAALVGQMATCGAYVPKASRELVTSGGRSRRAPVVEPTSPIQVSKPVVEPEPVTHEKVQVLLAEKPDMTLSASGGVDGVTNLAELLIPPSTDGGPQQRLKAYRCYLKTLDLIERLAEQVPGIRELVQSRLATLEAAETIGNHPLPKLIIP